VVKRNKYKSILNHLSSVDIDEKINYLNEKMSTTGIYVQGGNDGGTPAVPDVPATPPTYSDVDPGGLEGDGSAFVWPDQGDGNPANDPSVIVPTSLYSTYDGQQVPALRYIDTYNGQLLDYGDDLPIGALALRGGWLDWDYIGYLAGSGVRMVGTTRYPNGDIGNAIYNAYRNWPFPGKIVKTVYQWQSIDCLFGSCKGSSQYYPSGTTNKSNDGSPLAERALYAWTVWLPADAEGNLLRNRIQTSPGTPFIPGSPALPPQPIIISRDDLGDPNFFAGFISTILNVGRRGFEYLVAAAGGGPIPTPGPSPSPTPGPSPSPTPRPSPTPLPTPTPGPSPTPTPTPTPTPSPDETPKIPPGGALVPFGDGTYTILNADQLSRYKAGGGEAAINSGRSYQDVMNQGQTNLTNLNRKTKVDPNAGQSIFQSIVGTAADIILNTPGPGTAIKNLIQLKDTLPGVGTRVDIAASMISGKPIVYGDNDIPQYQKDALLNNIGPGTVNISYGEEQPYSDDNIVVDKNGNVRPNDGSSPNLTQPTSYNSSGFAGTGNPLHAAGQAQQQFVVPSDGSEPYYVYTDHAYFNAKSKDPGEIHQSDKLSPIIANTLQNTSPGLKGYPSNIRGDVVKTFRVPYSQLPQHARDIIDKEKTYQDYVRSGKIKVKGGMPVQEQVLSEEWQSPDHADVERDPRKRWFNPTSGTNPKNWFDPQDIAPDYPNNPPPEMIDGYSS
jgi:hypothetical protein